MSEGCRGSIDRVQWNAETFSWYSNDNRDKALASKPDKSDLDAGARLLNVIVVCHRAPALTDHVQRPYAIATAGTPISLAYDTSTSVFTYRFRTPVRPPVDAPPSAAVATEIYLPTRVYKEGQVEWLVSPGGRLQFDWERQRLWVWFVDVPSPTEKPRPDRVRRVDVWVPVKAKSMSDISILQWVLMVMGTALALALGWYVQSYQWERERKAGIGRSVWGF